MRLLLQIGLWLQFFATPQSYTFPAELIPISTRQTKEYTIEEYSQRNGPDTYQKVIMLIPTGLTKKAPAVAVPFYYPEAMIGGEKGFEGIEMMAMLAKRGFITISAESYHITYPKNCDLPKSDFKRWSIAAEQFNNDYPTWSGAGKLVADTRLMMDILDKDERVDKNRISVAGHSLGGKMAYYTGCLDKRVKAIIASDFGVRWEDSNWDAQWYWGDKLEKIKRETGEIGNARLLDICKCKAKLCLLCGEYDGQQSIDAVQKTKAYRKKRHADDFLLINHASGHRPPQWALDQAFDWLEKNQ